MAAQVTTIIEMRQDRAKLWEQAKGLHDKATSEKRGFDAAEQEQYDKLMAESDRLKATIDREERFIQEQAELESRATQPPAAGGAESRSKKAIETEEYRSAFFDMMSGREITSEQRSMLQEHRALSTSTSAPGAGYTVPQGFYNGLIEAMKWYGGMRQSRATVLRTASGNPLPIPNVDDTGNKAVIVAENAAAGLGPDPSFGQKVLGAYKYSSKTILISIELLQDSAFDLEAYLRRAIAERFGRGTNEHFTVGTGVGQPQGAVTGAAQGKVGATGQTTSITVDDLIDLEHSVDPAYRGVSQFMFADSSLKAIKKLKDNTGRLLWVPGVALNQPDSILNYSYIINSDMPAMAANAKSVLFGDFSKYFIRDVMDVTIIRMAEKYAESGQVGFIAFSRHDGALQDAGGPLKYYANSAT
ncbi:phage major capsid protein [Paenibacillus sp. RUD330]|uniref:phage major capsid protein n=1 Tax=Paenibacillus sp. RUD330 TaxID=2023772 RepID=UPI000B926664|nr:phage major capsid protein [Paenibacillus sp. RUD330]ASS64671.1 phage major capsid protein [Paenibacillus sp. RUD330]